MTTTDVRPYGRTPTQAMTVDTERLRELAAGSWRHCRLAASPDDLRSRVLFGPGDYFEVDPIYRLWLWPADVRDAKQDRSSQP